MNQLDRIEATAEMPANPLGDTEETWVKLQRYHGPGRKIRSEELDAEMARHMIAVGIVASDEPVRIGKHFLLCKQPCVVVGTATSEEFLEGVKRAGLPAANYHRFTLAGLRFYKISSD